MGHLTRSLPKPLIPVNGVPLVKHVLKPFFEQDFNQIYLLTGYKHVQMRRYFHKDIRIKCLSTGKATQTAGRLLAARKYIDSTFICTYGDGVADIDLKALIAFHRAHGRIATLTAVPHPSRYGVLDLKNDTVSGFIEKPDSWISGGFFVFEPGILNYIQNLYSVLEQDVFPELVKNNQLMAYRHTGFWKCCDTEREINELTRIVQKQENSHNGTHGVQGPLA